MKIGVCKLEVLSKFWNLRNQESRIKNKEKGVSTRQSLVKVQYGSTEVQYKSTRCFRQNLISWKSSGKIPIAQRCLIWNRTDSETVGTWKITWNDKLPGTGIQNKSNSVSQ